MSIRPRQVGAPGTCPSVCLSAGLTVFPSLQVRVPTHIVSSICDDRGEEPTYNGVSMTTLMEGDFCVGDVISLLWFKRQLPKYATRFIEMCVMLCADHGPCVSGE
jgi:ATP citrate (pro-S)-lyase